MTPKEVFSFACKTLEATHIIIITFKNGIEWYGHFDQNTDIPVDIEKNMWWFVVFNKDENHGQKKQINGYELIDIRIEENPMVN